MPPTEVATTQPNQTIRNVLETTDSETHVLNPTPATVTRLLDVYGPETQPALTIYAPKATYEAAISTFPFILSVASKTDPDGAKLLELPDSFPLTNQYANTFVTGEHVLAVIWDDDTAHVTGIEKAALVDSLNDRLAAAADDVSQYDYRAPPRDDLLEVFADRVGEPYAEQYETLLDELEELPCQRGRQAAFDTAIFAGGLTESQLYHISRATESVQFGTPPTYSRRKRELEEEGYIETEHIPADVGRPRERLVLPDEIEQSTDAVVEVLHSLHSD